MSEGLPERRVTIAGAGVAGLAVACRLAAEGWSTTVLERRPDLLEGGRAFLIQPNGLAALDRLGALDHVRAHGVQVERVVFYGPDHRPLATYDYGELRHEHAYAIAIRPPGLRSALAARLGELGAEAPRLSSELTGLNRYDGIVTGARHRDADGHEHELEADCVVGADGPGSTVRSSLGITRGHLSQPRTYVLGTVPLQTGVREVAVHCGSCYANGVAPLREGTYFWDCVSAENRVAVATRDLPAWREAYSRRLPPGSEVPSAIASWDQLTLVNVRPFWAADRIDHGVALVGDAAGVVHPHSAQGANLALEDAVALGDELSRTRGQGPVRREQLERYAHVRHRKLRRYVLWSLLAGGSLDGTTSTWRALRTAGFAWNRVGPMRRELLRRQAGLA